MVSEELVKALPHTDMNDPSAGSPTETLLRLLLPLNDKVRPSSRHKTSEALLS